ncbi:MAG: Crp/Fnr family transcriptional regulator [Bacillales bacterium]|nr:Crp/Fnr family transcriptional regulator [Bacillales bacterium]
MVEIDLLKDVIINVPYKNICFKKNQDIYLEGDIIEEIGIVISGSVLITSSTIDGFSFEIQRIEKGEIFADSLAILSKKILPGSIKAEENSEIMFINNKDFLKLLLVNNIFLMNYLKYISLRNVSHQYRIKLLGQPSIKEKILFYLKEEMKKSKSKVIYLNMTKEKLALFLGLNRPSLSRELQRMKSEGLIDYDLHKIVYLK